MIGERPDADFGLGRTSTSQAMARQGGSEAPHGYKLPVVLLYPGGWMPRTKQVATQLNLDTRMQIGVVRQFAHPQACAGVQDIIG